MNSHVRESDDGAPDLKVGPTIVPPLPAGPSFGSGAPGASAAASAEPFNRLDRFGLGRSYRLAATCVADVVCAVPIVERPFVALTRWLWRTPGIGRFCRSIAYRLADRLRDSGRQYRDITAAGVPLRADITHWTFSGRYFANVEYEPATTRFLMEHLAPASVFVDVGANSGYFTLLAAERVGPAGRVFAFEPNPPVYEELRRHVDLNQFSDRVGLFEWALSDGASPVAQLYVSSAHTGFSSLVKESAPGRGLLATGSALQVRTRSFDEWLLELAVDRIHVVKIDVEGAEHQVLAGMSGALASRRIDWVICETEWGGPAHVLLVSHGYVPQALESVGPVDNIAYARPGLLPPSGGHGEARA